MSDHIYVYDAIHVTPPVPEAEIEKKVADGTYVKVWNTDPRGEPGYLAKRPGALMGIFVCCHLADDGTATNAGSTIEGDQAMRNTHNDRNIDAIVAEVAQLAADFRTAEDGLVRLFDNVVAYEANAYLGGQDPVADYDTSTGVIVIREGKPVSLPEKEWRASRL